MTREQGVTRTMVAAIIATESFLVLIAIGAVLQAGPLRRAGAIVYPPCNVIRVVEEGTGTGSPRERIVSDSKSALCPDVRYGLAAVMLVLPVIFALQVYRGLRRSRPGRASRTSDRST